MSQQKWIKWTVGLAGVISFSAFVGMMNLEKGRQKDSAALPIVSPKSPSSQDEQALTADPVQAEWLYYEKKYKDHDDEHEEEFDEDDHDDRYEWRLTTPARETGGAAEAQMRRPSGRTRAS